MGELKNHQKLEIFTVEMVVNDVVRTFYFTTAESPVTYEGIQYIPLSSADAAKWLGDHLEKQS